MTDGDNYRNFSQAVRGLCNDARSGTLFVRTVDRHASMVLFDQGKITGVYFGSVKGRKAIAMLRTSGDLTYHFEDGRTPIVRQDLGSPAETLEELTGSSDPGQPAAAKQTRADTAPPAAAGQLGIDNVIARILAKQLGKYIGPAAQRVIGPAQRSALAVSTEEELRHAIRQLSADLLEADEQAPFEREAIAQVEALLKGQAVHVIAAQFVESLGPIGRGVFQSVTADLGGELKSPKAIERLVAALVATIDDGSDAADFVRRVRRALEALAP